MDRGNMDRDLAGRVFKVKIASGGNINLSTLAFRPAGTERKGPDIAAIRTPLPPVASNPAKR